MARNSQQIDTELLAEAITTAEQDGPLPNLSIFYENVATAYNKSRGKLPPINKSKASIKIKKLQLNHKTKAGKRGRVKGCITASTEDDILTPLSDWEENVIAVGKHAGKKSKSRWTIRFDARQWVLVKETETSVIPQKYYVSFFRLLPCVDEHFPELNIRSKIDDITHALRTRMGLPLDENMMEAIENIVDADYFDKAPLQEIGDKIDKAFNANFYWNDNLRDQLRTGAPVEEVAAA